METNISGGLNITLKDNTAMDDESNRFPLALYLIAISMFFIEAAVKIYKKNRNDLEPVHIFEINTLASIFFFLLVRSYSLMEVDFLCSLRNALAHYCRLNIFIGFLLSLLQTESHTEAG